MKFLVITRSLQSDYEWEKDAENIATIFLDLLKIQFPKQNVHYPKAFITYFARYIADSSVLPTDDKAVVHQKIADLIEEIELTGYEETKRSSEGKEVEYFKFNYTEKDYDLLVHLLDTTTKEYYLSAKPEIIDKVEFLKQDYGEKNICFINSSVFYAHLLNTFYDHHCQVFHSNFNETEYMLDELVENEHLQGDYEIISA
jgi:hypothetical protein